MNGHERTMPVLTAHYRAGHWTVVLPDGREITRKRAAAVERVVRREAPGTALRWTVGMA